MSNITWADKNKAGAFPLNTWRDADANEVKAAVNSKDELGAGNRLLRYAACILRCDANTSPDGLFSWTLLSTDDHEPLFFTGVTADSGTGALIVSHPTVAKVIAFSVTCDETLARAGISPGASVGLSSSTIDVWMPFGVYGGHLIGTGDGTFFTKNKDLTSFDMSLVSASEFLFNPPKPYGGVDATYGDIWRDCTVAYQGPNDYHIQRFLTGLGSYSFRYKIVDSTGTPIVSNTTDDIVSIISTAPKILRANCYENDSNGFPGGNVINNGANFFVQALYELTA